ncbi:hypothetical protein SCHPADRAFT_938079 [Schizopora paradoxa]|uniref:DUF6533 domain-containing protein n=1 Tax=Schizopora paradoxa TaxID=27342 RepID=A0A0H2RWF4_9AGAM|nr:hypothetical protein SCHPADRAFT_938079 [Schizopora paradoxa]
MPSEDPTTVDQFYILASSTVFLYDMALTMPQEIQYLWSFKLKPVNVLLLALRYVTALGFVPVLDESSVVGKVPGVVGVICQALTLAFLILRLYAIYEKQNWILYGLIPFSLLSVVFSSLVIREAQVYEFKETNTITIGDVSYNTTISASCFLDPSLDSECKESDTSVGMFYRLSYIVNISLDTLIFLLAATKTARMYSQSKLCGMHSSLSTILLRDGSILYAMLAMSNITNFVLYMRSVQYATGNTDPFLFVVSSGTNSEMTHALSAILVSRMVFNLREAGTELHESTSEWRSRIEFQSIHQENDRRLRN